MSPVPLPSSPFYRRRIFWIFLLLLLACGVVWRGVSVDRSGAGAVSHGKFGVGAVVSVGVATAQKGDSDMIRHALGTVTPLANVTVRTQISGQLIQVAFQEGQIVQAGDFLAQIDPRPYQMALEQTEGAHARDLALLTDAQLNLKRYKTLMTQESISRQQLDTQQALVDQYKGSVETDQGQIDAAKLNLTYSHITAPIAGRLGLRQVDQGNYAQVSDTNGLVSITQLQPITVLFTLPEDDVPTVMKRLEQGAILQATAYDRTRSTKLATGKLVAVDNQIDTATGTVKLRAEFDNQDKTLFPNQFVNVDLLVDSLRDVTLVPSAAIQRGASGTFVYLLKEDNTVSVQPVKLGPSQGDQVAVFEGLAAGNKVVIDGTDKLRDGAKVTIPEVNSPSSPEGAKGQGTSLRPHRSELSSDK